MTVKTRARRRVLLVNKPQKMRNYQYEWCEVFPLPSAHTSFFWQVTPCVLLDRIFSDISDERSAIVFKITLNIS